MMQAGKMLCDLSQAQDVEAGDGTTSVVVLCGSLLIAAERLLAQGMHPTIISDAFGGAARKSVEILKTIAVPVELTDREQLIKCASTSLNSKVVSQYSGTIAPMVVDAVLKVQHDGNCDLRDIKIVKKIGGTIEDTELVDGVVFDRKVSHMVQGGTDRVESAKIAMVQFCLSPPKTDLDNQASSSLLPPPSIMSPAHLHPASITFLHALYFHSAPCPHPAWPLRRNRFTFVT
jgi:T-complex protein 1 subunit delta